MYVTYVLYVFYRLNNEENNQENMSLLGKDSKTAELEGKQSKKLVKSRLRSGKMEFPMDCGAEFGKGMCYKLFIEIKKIEIVNTLEFLKF